MSQPRVSVLVFRVYSAFTLYALLLAAATSLSIANLLPAVVFMWLSFLMFVVGEGKPIESAASLAGVREARRWSNMTLVCLALASLASAIVSAHYYTGQSPSDVVKAITSGTSTYAAYQAHFASQALASFSFTKTPYVLMMALTKAVAIISWIRILTARNTVTFVEKAYLVIVSAAHFYFGLARGTNFEVFELGAVFLFSYSSRRTGGRMSFRRLWVLVAVGLVSLSWFQNSVRARGYAFSETMTADVRYDPDGIFWVLLPDLAFSVTTLFGYFGFGLFYLSYWIGEVWLDSLANFVAGLLPTGYYLTAGVSIQSIMIEQIDFGVRWHPDAAVYINLLGVVGALAFVWVLGRFVRSIDAGDADWLTNGLRFIIFLQMLSWPVGNFVTVSTSTMLIVAVWVTVFLKRRFEAIAGPRLRRRVPSTM